MAPPFSCYIKIEAIQDTTDAINIKVVNCNKKI